MIYLPKSKDAPPCLAIEKAKASGTYRCEGVANKLKDDFHNKCYICETKEPHSINIEHFIPHRGNRDLKFDWHNLFYCCTHCNNIKGAKTDFDTILNCTMETDMDTHIKYELKPFPKEKPLITAMINTQKVENTVKLLNEVYNGTTEQKVIEAANLRAALLREIRTFNARLDAFKDEGYNSEEREYFKRKITQHLTAKSAYTAFKRWIVRDNAELFAEFAEYL